MIALVTDPLASALPAELSSPLFIIGCVVLLVGWVMLLVLAFKEKVWWGLLVLVGPFVVDMVVGANAWASLIGSLIVILPFALPRFSQAKIGVGFALLAIGGLMTIPGANALYRFGETQEKAGLEAQQKPAPKPEPAAVTPYVPPPIEAAAVPAPQKRIPKEASTAPPEMVAPEIVQVFVVNAGKKYYPLDCPAALPEGAYKMAKSMAVRQGYKLAPGCAK